MRVRRALLLGLLCLGTALGLPSPAPPSLAAPPAAPVAARESTARVLRVVDGDTVVVALGGRAVTVRLIGVDTPESVHPKKPVERFAREASAFLKELIGGKPVRLEYERGASDRDRYGRTLAYLYVEPGGLFVNREIVARGYGHAYTRFPFAFMEDFRAAERTARERQLGLWGAGPESTNPSPSAPPAPAAAATVFVTQSGTRYHRAGCRYLTETSTSLPLAEAAARLKPCSICDPPVPARAPAEAVAAGAAGSL